MIQETQYATPEMTTPDTLHDTAQQMPEPPEWAQNLVSDWLTGFVPIFRIDISFTRHETFNLTYQRNGQICDMVTSVYPANPFFPMASMRERKLWLLILNKCIKQKKNSVVLTLADIFHALSLNEKKYHISSLSRPKSVHNIAKINHEFLRKATDDVCKAVEILNNTCIDFSCENELAIKKVPLISRFSVNAKNATYPHHIKFTFVMHDFFINEVKQKSLALPNGYLNIQTGKGLKLYEWLLNQDIEVNKPLSVPLEDVLKDIDDSVIYKARNGKFKYRENFKLLVRVVNKYESVIQEEKFPNFNLTLLRNEKMLVIEKTA